MKHSSFFRVFTALSIVVLSLFSVVFNAQAMGTATVGTTLTFEPPVPVSVGNSAIIVAQLISTKGLPVAGQPVQIFVNGEAERRSRTDGEGRVTFKVKKDKAGTYALSAVFNGSKAPSLGSSKAAADLVVVPELIEVRITPPLPNVKFALDDRVFVSDDYGVARIEVPNSGKYHLELLPLDTKDPDIQMAFGRWSDDYFVPSRDIEIPLKTDLQVGLEVSYQVSQRFVDLQGKPVDRSRISSITLKGSNGSTYTFEDNLPHWLPAGRVIRLNNGLEETKILYSVFSVVIDGSNVVSQAQQRFYANPNDVWPVKLLLYSASFSARDALFHFPTGTGIHVEYPDGDVETFDFKNNKQSLSGLARGIYKVTVIGAQGFAPPTPIALSRNQDVELMVFSYLDMGVLGSIGVIVALGLLIFGRPYLVRQTVTLPIRTYAQIRKFKPAQVKEFYNKIIAAGTGIVSKKGRVRLEDNKSANSLNEIAPEDLDSIPSTEFSQSANEEMAAVDEPIAPIPASSAEIGDGMPENVSSAVQGQNETEVEDSQIEVSEHFESKRPRRHRRKNKVESLV
jgi:hypothetical protein